jgi:hypothetical protein
VWAVLLDIPLIPGEALSRWRALIEVLLVAIAPAPVEERSSLSSV